MSYIKQFYSLFDFVDQIDKRILFYGIIAFLTLEFLWENYLSFRQYRVERKSKSVPSELLAAIDTKTFEKSRSYSLDKRAYNFVHGLYSQLESYLILFLGALPFLWNLSGEQLSALNVPYLNGEIPRSVLFSLYAILYGQITGLPWNLYYTFVLEEKHGFNKQTLGFYAKDQLKKLAVNLVLTMPILSLFIYIVRIGGDYFFIYAWLFVLVVSLFLILIYADYIAPLFDKYTPLPDGELRQRIEELAKSLGFPLYKLYVVEGSKRSVHSNAYMYGFYKAKRIVLFDTLIEGYKPAESDTANNNNNNSNNRKNEQEQENEAQAATDLIAQEQSETNARSKGCNTEEIVAVLAHELGHWKLNHTIKQLVLSQINSFLTFLIFAILINRQVFYSAFGFDTHERPVLIGIIIIVQFLFAPYHEILSFAMNALSRRFEFQADAFAKNLHKAEYLKSALIKLQKDNLSFPVTDWLYSTWHYTHPPLIERLKALNEQADDKNKRKSS